MRRSTLSETQKRYVVCALACYESQNSVIAFLASEWGVELSTSAVQHYDPTTLAGKKLSKELVQLFWETRKEWNGTSEHIDIYHLKNRLAYLSRGVQKAEQRGNLKQMGELLEQAAKEVGGFFTNTRNVKVENLSVENRLCQLLKMTPEELCLPSKRPLKALPSGNVVEGAVTETVATENAKKPVKKNAPAKK